MPRPVNVKGTLLKLEAALDASKIAEGPRKISHPAWETYATLVYWAKKDIAVISLEGAYSQVKAHAVLDTSIPLGSSDCRLTHHGQERSIFWGLLPTAQGQVFKVLQSGEVKKI